MDVDEARRRLMTTDAYKQYNDNVKLFSARSKGGKNFRAVKELTESVNLVPGEMWDACANKGREEGRERTVEQQEVRAGGRGGGENSNADQPEEPRVPADANCRSPGVS